MSKLTNRALLLLSLHLLILLSTFPKKTASQAQKPFNCSKPQGTTCSSIIDYVSPNTTTLSSIKTLFSIKNLRTLLAANNFPLSTPSNQTVSAKQTLKIPFPCLCHNSTGVSNHKPVYVVQSGDGLDHIAVDVFSRLVTYQEIADANNITNVNLIEIGQELWIPLPCSCDDVEGESVMHYGHVVKAGSSLDGIAMEFGRSKELIMSLNGIANESSLLAGQVLDVPLQACNSSIRSDSVDYPLLVPNGTYAVTAHGCVTCACSSTNNWTLQCEPSGLRPSNWSTCPSMRCVGAESLYLGNTTTASCNTTTCAYAGFYANQTILTTPDTESTCPVSNPNSGCRYAAAHESWSFVFVSAHLIVMLYVHLLW